METELTAVRRDVAYLMDRTQIMDCIAGHARGCDRHDVDLITAAYHRDGIDEHGNVTNLGAEYGDWANRSVHQWSICRPAGAAGRTVAHSSSQINGRGDVLGRRISAAIVVLQRHGLPGGHARPHRPVLPASAIHRHAGTETVVGRERSTRSPREALT